MCYRIFKYDRKDKNTRSQTNGSIKYIKHTWRCDTK